MTLYRSITGRCVGADEDRDLTTMAKSELTTDRPGARRTSSQRFRPTWAGTKLSTDQSGRRRSLSRSIHSELAHRESAGRRILSRSLALAMAAAAIREGAHGVDMGRNIFQSSHPAAMMQAVRKVVHEGASPAEAHDLFLSLKG